MEQTSPNAYISPINTSIEAQLADLREQLASLTALQHQLAEGQQKIIELTTPSFTAYTKTVIPRVIARSTFLTRMYVSVVNHILFSTCIAQFLLFAFYEFLVGIDSRLNAPATVAVFWVCLVLQICWIGIALLWVINCLRQISIRAMNVFEYLATYGAMVLSYGGLFVTLMMLDRNSFNGVPAELVSGSPLGIFTIWISLTYYSAQCLASVGFGDLSPQTNLTRFLVGTETFVSVIFLCSMPLLLPSLRKPEPAAGPEAEYQHDIAYNIRTTERDYSAARGYLRLRNTRRSY